MQDRAFYLKVKRDTDVKDLLDKGHLDAKDLDTILYHALLPQSGKGGAQHPNHDQNLDVVLKRIAHVGEQQMTLDITASILTTLVKYGPDYWPRFQPLLPLLKQAIAVSLPRKAPAWTPLGLVNALCGLVNLGAINRQDDSKLLNEIARHAVLHFAEFDVKQMVRTIWSFATVAYPAPALFEAFARHATGKIDLFNAQDLANTVWAFVTTGQCSSAEDLFRAVASRASDNIIRTFNAQNLANTAWAFATAGFGELATVETSLFKAIAGRSINIMETFQAQQIANLAWAFATARLRQPELFSAMKTRAMAIAASFKAQEVANLLWAFVTLAHDEPDLFEAFLQPVVCNVAHMDSRAMRPILWAYNTYVLKGRLHPLSLDPKFYRRFATSAHRDERDLTVLNQWRLTMDKQTYEKVVRNIPAMKALFDQAMGNVSALSVRASHFQSDVGVILKSIGEPFAEEFVCPRTQYSIDFASWDRMIALEVNGPSHFLRDGSFDGATLFKDGVLKKYGWTVVHVNGEEWASLGDDRERKQAFLRQKLAAAQQRTITTHQC